MKEGEKQKRKRKRLKKEKINEENKIWKKDKEIKWKIINLKEGK